MTYSTDRQTDRHLQLTAFCQPYEHSLMTTDS